MKVGGKRQRYFISKSLQRSCLLSGYQMTPLLAGLSREDVLTVSATCNPTSQTYTKLFKDTFSRSNLAAPILVLAQEIW